MSSISSPAVRIFYSGNTLTQPANVGGSVNRDTWNLKKLCKEDPLEEALDIIEQRNVPISKDDAYYFLQDCAGRNEPQLARRVQLLIYRNGIESISVLADHLIRLFASLDCLLEANQAFSNLSHPSVYTWSSIISAHVNAGQTRMTLELYYTVRLYEAVKANKDIYRSVLKTCTTLEALDTGKHVHAQIMKIGLQVDCIIGNMLLYMYAKCASLEESCKLFDCLPNRDIVSWGAMIAAYIQHDKEAFALDCFKKMEQEKIFPNKIIFLSMLRAFSKMQSLEQGRYMHKEIVTCGLESDIVIGNTILNMYIKCGDLIGANSIYKNLEKPDIISFNIMIAGYVQHGESLLALECFSNMFEHGIMPGKVTFLSILKACGNVATMKQGLCVHELIIEYRLHFDVFIGSALVDMYGRCGNLGEAHRVFESLPNKNVVSWSAMIGGYAHHGQAVLALECFNKMQEMDIKPSQVTFLGICKACSCIGNLMLSRWAHEQIIEHVMLVEIHLWNAIIDMHVKSGNLKEAMLVFRSLPLKNLVTWCTIITGYAQNGEGILALDTFHEMQGDGEEPDKVTFLGVLKGCGSIGTIEQGRQVHEHIFESRLHLDAAIGNALVDMYAKCNKMDEAYEIFSRLQNQDVVSWCIMIEGYTLQGEGCLAIRCFKTMLENGITPDKVIFVSILKACATMKAVEEGRHVHTHIIASRLLFDVDVGNTLIDMYSKCGNIEESCAVFDKLQGRDVTSWNALIQGYVLHGEGNCALLCFERMQHQGIKPDCVTFSSILKGCAKLGAIEWGKCIHKKIVERGLELDGRLGSGLVDMYAKCGNLKEACAIFNELTVKDVVSWTAIIAGYEQNNQGLRSLDCFDDMQDLGIVPDKVTLLIILKACGSLGAATRGRHIFDQINARSLQFDLDMSNTLIDMYAKSGHMEVAQEVFCKLQNHDVVSCNALIAGYAQHGDSEYMVECLKGMLQDGIRPNDVTLSSVLIAFSHAGLMDEGHFYYLDIRSCYGIAPNMFHHNCLVDLLSRAGCFDEAEDLLQTMKPNIHAWTTLLSACNLHGNLELGNQYFKHIMSINSDCPAAYVLMSNLYANAQRRKNL